MHAHHHAVMVVDDYADLQEASVFLLEGAGYVVRRSDSGPEALAMLAAGYRPCVMLLDVAMPGMTGLEVQARMAADPALAAIPVVLLSGTSDVVAADHAGAAARLGKPVEPSVLFAAIEEHASCARGSRRNAVRSTIRRQLATVAIHVRASRAMATTAQRMVSEARSDVSRAHERTVRAVERLRRLPVA